MSVKVDIVIPVYNEEKILEKNFKRVYDFLKENCEYPWRIIIAENGSTDRTLEIAKRLAKSYSRVDCISLSKKGRGRALKKAWLSSNSDILCYMDADLSANLESLPKMINAIVGGNDIAIGSRLIKGAKTRRSLKREILSRGYNLLLRWVLSVRISDAQCGFKAINKKIKDKVLPLIEDSDWFFDTEMLVLAEKYGYKIKEVPIEWVEDKESKVKIFSTIVYYLKSMWDLKKRLKGAL